VLQKAWAWWTHYDGARAGAGFPSPSTLLFTGVAAVVIGIVALAKGSAGAGVFVLILGVVFIAWAEKWRRVPVDD
jgi:uncharacterized membrane protein HdeD (DUF308 family)